MNCVMSVIMSLMTLTGLKAPADTVLTYGPNTSIAAAVLKARQCGMIDLRRDPLNDTYTVLLISDHNSAASIACARAWIDTNRVQMGFMSEDEWIAMLSQPSRD